ncbi:MAG: hypothetical protein LBD48_09620 [Treponema sp.]|nr:hypothetical protein [Treponema sp.]
MWFYSSGGWGNTASNGTPAYRNFSSPTIRNGGIDFFLPAALGVIEQQGGADCGPKVRRQIN